MFRNRCVDERSRYAKLTESELVGLFDASLCMREEQSINHNTIKRSLREGFTTETRVAVYCTWYCTRYCTVWWMYLVQVQRCYYLRFPRILTVPNGTFLTPIAKPHKEYQKPMTTSRLPKNSQMPAIRNGTPKKSTRPQNASETDWICRCDIIGEGLAMESRRTWRKAKSATT